MSQKFTVQTLGRKKKEFEITIDSNTKIDEIKNQIYQQTHIPKVQQMLKLSKNSTDGITLDDNDQTVSFYKFSNYKVLLVKNIGTQVSWSLVFYVEYFGPILIFSLFYFLTGSHNFLQLLAYILVMFHYIKRELETMFIHIFSRDTMPFFNLFKNSFHYWVLCGLLISVELFYFNKQQQYSETVMIILAFLMTFSEIMNFLCHYELKKIRNSSSYETLDQSQKKLNPRKRRAFPNKFGFGLVLSANYFWEVLSWVFFAILVNCWTAYLFLMVSAIQMAIWAIKKKERYQKEYPNEVRGKRAIIPFIL